MNAESPPESHGKGAAFLARSNQRRVRPLTRSATRLRLPDATNEGGTTGKNSSSFTDVEIFY